MRTEDFAFPCPAWSEDRLSFSLFSLIPPSNWIYGRLRQTIPPSESAYSILLVSQRENSG
jgi:hypothetical protein